MGTTAVAMSISALRGRFVSALTLSSAAAPTPANRDIALGSCGGTVTTSSASSALHGGRLTAMSASVGTCGQLERRRRVAVGAEAASGGSGEIEAEAAKPAAKLAAGAEGELNPVAALKLQSELLKKKAKRLELRRKRLVRKRHLRKKGRWPPSKMWKNKNV